MVSALGLVRVVPNSELVRQEQEAARQAAYEANQKPLLQGLARYVMDCWESANRAKQSVLPRLKRAQRARLGEYEPDKLQAIREFGGSEEYARISANKCRIVEAWLRDVFIGQTEKPWALSPTPKPDFPPDIEQQVRTRLSQEVAAIYATTGQLPDPTMVRSRLASDMEAFEEALRDEARKSTQRMERKMHDQLVEGGFIQALGEFIADLVVYQAAIMKGPILRRRKRLSWKNTEGGAVTPLVTDEIICEFERVDPFRFYPAPGALSTQDGYCIEHLTFDYQDLYELIGSPGFNEEAIRAVLAESGNGGLSNWLGFVQDGNDERADPQSRELRQRVFNIDCLEFHGPVKGSDLLEWGIEASEVDDPDATYDACVWLIDRWVIKAQLNYDPLGVRPYYKASYENLPGEFWGMGIPDVLDDMQGVVNAAVRALVNNMGMASGPQVEVNTDRLDPAEDPNTIYPWKRWKTIDSQFGQNSPAIQFFQPQSNVQELLLVIEKFYQFADDFSLVPRYMAGSDKAAGAGRTASGLSMLMDAANKGLKGVVSNVDTVLKAVLEKLYAHNMMYDPDSTLKGDAQVEARGAVGLMQLETLQLRRNEFLNITANPFDMQIVGLEGRAEVLRETAKGLELDTGRVVPSREALAAKAAMPPAMPGAPGGQPQGISASGETLANGAPVTDNFGPNNMVSA